ncbi:MAG: hypothetical protein IBX47_06985 [Desulfuromonadales bacterium]|nr:hypothetical protein [Desulfuromonadales bacterium]
MKCPVCKTTENSEINLHADGFYEDLYECENCNTIWSVHHGMTEVVKDSQRYSFLEAVTEAVEADDYAYAGI